MFIPSLGLFSLLHHWRNELIPFRIRIEYAKYFQRIPDNPIELYEINETILWSELDRWNYSDPVHPTPPPYSVYTLLTLGNTLMFFIILTFIQFVFIFAVKMKTSKVFRENSLIINMVIHVLENLNYATPFKDWDQWTEFSVLGEHGNNTIAEYRERFQAVKKEMLVTLTVNFVFTVLMMIPLWFCGM